VEAFQDGGAKADPSKPSNGFTYGEAKRSAINAHQSVFEPPCNEGCLESQLDGFYGEDNEKPLNLPEEKQDLGDSTREHLKDTWGETVSQTSKGLKQGLGDLFKKAGIAVGT
jgi:hypothetical protein